MKAATVFTFFLLALCYTSTVHAVVFDWATIGSPGNVADDTGFGAVDYTYRISKHEVTNAQYTEFLNAVAATDTYSLFDDFSPNPRNGITRSGSLGSYTYAVKDDFNAHTYGNKPVIYITFFDAMRFTNWLENGQPTGMQDDSTTEDGVYKISDGSSEVRSPGARYFIPSEDEWYKAAYYDPTASAYYEYPTSTDQVPNNNLSLTDTGNSANFDYATGNLVYSLTDVGEYTLSSSPFGTFDQGGNVAEWNEAIVSSTDRGFSGGSFRTISLFMSASNRSFGPPTYISHTRGFRVASFAAIPEPTTLTLYAFGLIGLCYRRRKRA